MFERATRIALRFESPIGLLSVEDLWGLPLKDREGKANLDNITRHYFQKLESNENVFFVEEVVDDAIDQLRFDILKHIIKVRLEEKASVDKLREMLDEL